MEEMQHTDLGEPMVMLCPGQQLLQLTPQSSMGRATTTYVFLRGMCGFLWLSFPSPVSFHLAALKSFESFCGFMALKLSDR